MGRSHSGLEKVKATRKPARWQTFAHKWLHPALEPLFLRLMWEMVAVFTREQRGEKKKVAFQHLDLKSSGFESNFCTTDT